MARKTKALSVGDIFSVKLPEDEPNATTLKNLLNAQPNRNKFVIDSLMMRANTNHLKQAGEAISVDIPLNAKKATLVWLNTKDNLSKAIWTLIEQAAEKDIANIIATQYIKDNEKHEEPAHIPAAGNEDTKVSPVIENEKAEIKSTPTNPPVTTPKETASATTQVEGNEDDELM